MGFISGVITGVALSGVAAAWYLSRSGERFREQYRVEHRLAEIGDELEERTRDIQATVNAQLAELRGASDAESWTPASDATLDPAAASAAEAEAAAALEAGPGESTDDAPTKRVRKPKAAPSE